MVLTNEDDAELVDDPGDTDEEVGGELLPLVLAPGAQHVPHVVNVHVL